MYWYMFQMIAGYDMWADGSGTTDASHVSPSARSHPMDTLFYDYFGHEELLLHCFSLK